MESQNIRYYRFGEFELDSRRRTLFKNDLRLDISAKNFDLLYALIQNEGRILTHDELLDTVWSGTFVEQSNLKKGISALRHLLDETPDESTYIKTIPRQGYSFVAEVTPLPEEEINEIYRGGSQMEIFIEQTEEIIDDGDDVRDLPAKPGPRRNYLIAAIAFVALAVAATAGWRYFSRNTRPSVLENIRIEKLTTDGNCYGKLSPDNNFIVCTMADAESGVALEIQQLATGDRRRLVSFPNAAVYSAQFSPDGNFIYFVLNDFIDPQKGGVYKVSVLGGESRFVVGRASSLTLSSSGKMALSRTMEGGGFEIVVTDMEGGNPTRAASFPANFRIWDFRFSAGDSTLLCAVRKQLTAIKNVFYVTEFSLVDGSEKIIVPERDTLIANAVWTQGRDSLLLCIREPNADIKQVWQYFPSTGAMSRLTNDNTSYRDIAVLKNGTIAAVAETVQSNIWVADVEDLDFRNVTTGVQSLANVFWTRDGRIGYAAVENSAEVVRVASLDGRTRERINDGKDGYWIQPALTGDGQGVTLNSNRAGFEQLWRIGLDGKDPRQLTRSETPVFNGRQLSDGSVIYKTLSPQDGWLIIRLTPDGRSTRLPLHDADVWNISPDERLIAVLVEDGKAKVRTISIHDITSGEIVNVLRMPERGALERLTWTRDSRTITYALVDNGSSEIFQQSIDGGEPKKLTNFRYERISALDWSNDGKKLAVIRGRTFTDPVLLHPGNTK